MQGISGFNHTAGPLCREVTVAAWRSASRFEIAVKIARSDWGRKVAGSIKNGARCTSSGCRRKDETRSSVDTLSDGLDCAEAISKRLVPSRAKRLNLGQAKESLAWQNSFNCEKKWRGAWTVVTPATVVTREEEENYISFSL
jgi:hypothetical protein